MNSNPHYFGDVKYTMQKHFRKLRISLENFQNFNGKVI